jgi:hypothetical protein
MYAVQVRNGIIDPEVAERIRPQGMSFVEELKAVSGVDNSLTIMRYEFIVTVVDRGMDTTQGIINAFKKAYEIDNLTVV